VPEPEEDPASLPIAAVIAGSFEFGASLLATLPEELVALLFDSESANGSARGALCARESCACCCAAGGCQPFVTEFTIPDRLETFNPATEAAPDSNDGA
jgi:hypothetical protein